MLFPASKFGPGSHRRGESISAAPRSVSCDLLSRWLLAGRSDPESAAFEVALTGSEFSVGRHPENDLCLRNPTVSGRHARFVVAETEATVVDLQSTNGTFVNGRRVRGTVALRAGDILQFGTAVFELKGNSASNSNSTMEFDVATDALALLEFNRLLTEPALIPNFQPIVSMASTKLVGYEVLMRSNLPQMETPAEMFRIAAQRSAEMELSSLARCLGVQAGHKCALPLYINTHPCEVNDPGLLDSLTHIRIAYPSTPLYLEIHEAAITSTSNLALLRQGLNDLNIRLAYDDFGAGQARLLELVEVPPDVIKFDMCLIRGIGHASAERQRLVQSLVDIVRQFGVITLAEGVETVEEDIACRQIGFELAQGFLYGRPMPPPPRPLELGVASLSSVCEPSPGLPAYPIPPVPAP